MSTGILFQQATGTNVQFIPYRGAGPGMTDLLAGQVDLLVVQARGRAAAGARRHDQGAREPVAASVRRRCPTFRPRTKAACPGSTCRAGSASLRPKGTPKDVIAKLNGAMVAGARRSRGAQALRRSGTGCRLARAADAGGPCRLQQGRDREMVADHQGRRHQGGMTPPAAGRELGPLRSTAGTPRMSTSVPACTLLAAPSATRSP